MRAFVYKEIHSRTTESEEPVLYYIMTSPAEKKGCCEVKTTDEEIILKEIRKKMSEGVNIVSGMPYRTNKLEQEAQVYQIPFPVMIEREPYYFNSSFKASAGDKRNK